MISDDVVKWLGLYNEASKQPNYGELFLPRWAADELRAMPKEESAAIMLDVDRVAASFGLKTPVRIIIVEAPNGPA